MNLKNLYARLRQLESLYEERDEIIDNPNTSTSFKTLDKLSLINKKIAELEVIEIK